MAWTSMMAAIILIVVSLLMPSSQLALNYSHAAERILLPAIPVPLDFFGMHTLSYDQPWPTEIEIGALGKGTLTGWPYIERSAGVYTWTDLDRWVALAEAHKIGIFHTIGPGSPEWATSNRASCRNSAIGGIKNCTALPADLSRIDSFVSALVARYKGRIRYYEMANEPDSYTTATDLVAYVNNVVPIIRKLDPAAKIISASMNGRNPGIMKEYFSRGGTTDFDVLSIHSYPPTGNPYNVPESIDVNWSATGNVHLLAPLRPILAQHGLEQKPIWSTEGSWGNRTYATGAANDQDLEAAFVARYHLLHWSNGVTRAYWYAWPVGGTNWGSLKGRKGAMAYREVQNWMINATMTSMCAASGTVWSCLLSRPHPNNYRAQAVWDTAGPSVYRAPDEFKVYRDLEGNQFNIPQDHEVPIGLKPLLFASSER